MNKNLITQLLVAYGIYKLYEAAKGNSIEALGDELKKAVSVVQDGGNSLDLQKLFPIALSLFGAQSLVK